MMTLSDKQKTTTAIIVIIGLLIGQMSVDLYLPSLPAMRHYFQTSAATVQMSLSLYLIGYGLGHPVCGSFSDHLGRKPILLIGTAVILIGALLCSLTTSLWVLLVARFIQGCGGSAFSLIWKATLRDIYEGPDFLKMMSYSSMTWVTIPVLAPLLGSYIQTYLGWRFNFALLALLSALFLLVVLFYLPETLSAENHSPLNLKNSALSYKQVLSTPQFMVNTFCWAILCISIIGFLVAAPFLFQVALHFSPVQYGWTLVFIAAGCVISSYLNTRIVNYQRILKIGFTLGLWSFFLCGLFMLITGWLGIFNLWVVAVPMFILFFFTGIVFPQCISRAMAPFTQLIGVAGAVWGTILFFTAAIGTSIVAYLPENNQLHFSIVCVICAILAILLYYGVIQKSNVSNK
ncbi:MAG: multidrug effflux MFS transporter [Pseudomonadota bacterium]